jgi:hypothetical protein
VNTIKKEYSEMNKITKALVLALSIAFVLTGHGDKIDEINSVQQTAKDLTAPKELQSLFFVDLTYLM